MVGTANREGIHMIGFVHVGVVFKQLPDHHLSLHNLLTLEINKLLMLTSGINEWMSVAQASDLPTSESKQYLGNRN